MVKSKRVLADDAAAFALYPTKFLFNESML